MSAPRVSRSSARWLFVASAAAVVLFAGVPLYEAWVVPSADSALVPHRPRLDPRALGAVEAVLSPAERGPEPTLPELVDNLVALKSRVIPVLIGVLCGEVSLPEFASGTRDQPVHPRAIELREAAVGEALRRFPPADVAEHLRVLGQGAALDICLVAARLLGDCDHASALATLLEIARGIEPIQLQRTYVRETIESALAKHFARHPAAIEGVEVLGADDVWPVLVRAAGASRTSTSARWLAGLLGRTRDLDLAVVEELGRSAAGGRFALPEEVIERMRDALPRNDDSMRRVAAVALGQAREGDAFDELVFLLDETDPLVVIAARHGLTAIAGTDLGAAPDAWLDWRVAQDEWYAANSQRLLDELDSGDPARATGAMGDMLAHSFFRHEWAYEIGGLLIDSQGPLFATACAATAALGSSRAVDWLLEALRREDEHERELARDALRALTGLDLPSDYEAWRSALER